MSVNRVRILTALALVRLSQPKFDDGFFYADVSSAYESASHIMASLLRMGLIERLEKEGRGHRHMVTESGYRLATEIEEMFNTAISE